MATRHAPPIEAALKVDKQGHIVLPLVWLDWFRRLGTVGDTSGLSKATASFTQAHLVAGVYTFTHALGVSEIILQVFNESFEQMTPDNITLINSNTAQIDVTSWGDITGKNFLAIAVG